LFFIEIGVFIHNTYLLSSEIQVNSATDHALNIYGPIKLPIFIGNEEHNQTVHVTDSLRHCSIEMDFIHSHGCQVDLTGKMLYSNVCEFRLLSSTQMC
jgi:hypothetical protein